MAEDKKKQEILATKDGWILGDKKYPKEQPPPEVVQELAKSGSGTAEKRFTLNNGTRDVFSH